MRLKLAFLGRMNDRWRVRVELAHPGRHAGLTVGLWSESGHLLGPVVVAPEEVERCWVAELRGPCHLPPGTQVRATLDMEDGESFEECLGVDARRGLHAFLHADGILPLENAPRGSGVTAREQVKLGRVFPWVCNCGLPEPPPVDDPLLNLLRTEFDVDPDDLSDELLASLRRSG